MSELMEHSEDIHEQHMKMLINHPHPSKFDMNNVPVVHTLDDLAKHLHEIFSYDSVNVDYVVQFLKNFNPTRKEWISYAKYDPYKYTRNLIDKGNGKFNLILLCWAESQGSSIHDHANSHCFVKMLDGELSETMYDWPTGDQTEMQERNRTFIKKNEVTYINDTIGLHRVENPSHSRQAVSLHIYIPPFDECNTFDAKTCKKRACKVTFFSIDGNKINYCADLKN